MNMKLQQLFSLFNKGTKTMPRRRYHLGLDWGTSATKLVLRDYEQNKAFVLFPGGIEKAYRYPSTITVEDSRVYFGFEAEKRRKSATKVFDALKAVVCQRPMDRHRTGKDEEEEDLATLSLAHSISIGLDYAEKHANRGKAEALMGMTLGVPAEELDRSLLRDVYLRMARAAYEIAVRIGCDPQGEKSCNSLQALKYARERIAEKDRNKPPDKLAYVQWLRPEMAAAMYWGIKSPNIQPDLYSCVDIGAWTTNASYFRIHASNGEAKGGISFYGGSCRPPGMIELLKEVARELNQDYIFLIGKENGFLSRPELSRQIDEFSKQYFVVWKEGFQRSYAKEKSQSVWDGKLNVMVVGGGAKVDRVRRMFHERFPYAAWQPPNPVPDLGVPTDLYHFPGKGVLAEQPFSGDHTFLLVAYGLSVDSRNFPHTTLSPQVEPFQPTARSKRFLDFEEMGYDK